MTIDAIRGMLRGGVDLQRIPGVLLQRWRATAVLALFPAVAAGALGYALPRWYQAGATLNVDTGPGLGANSGVLGLASQLGLAGTLQPQSPQFYADLLTTRVLIEHLLSARLPLGGDSLESLETYWDRGEPLNPRRHERNVQRLLSHSSASANPRTGLISFSVEGPSPLAARVMVDTALTTLNEMVVRMRRQRATSERMFLELQWNALHDSLVSHEGDLKRFYERNRQVASPELQFEEASLKREVDRVQAIYVQLGTQLEQARLQEVRDTPVISVIDPPTTPVRRSEPNIKLLALTGLLIGCCVALMWALLTLAGETIQS